MENVTETKVSTSQESNSGSIPHKDMAAGSERTNGVKC
jgi:hypothetical protein